MRIRLLASAITLGVCLVASRTLAHHSMGTYDQSSFGDDQGHRHPQSSGGILIRGSR